MKQVFVITGTRKGIGKKLSEYYLENGNNVVGCSRGQKSIDHPDYTHYEVDVANEKDVVEMVRSVYRSHKRIDVLLNNAGIASMNHALMTPYKTAQEIFFTNFFGTFLFCREVTKIMMKKKYGRIVNFSTVAVPLNLEGESIYASSKAAVVNFTEVLSKEVADYGITVNTIGPTPVMTDLIRAVPEEKLKSLLKQQSISRFGEFNDIVNVINFFIDVESRFVTGQTIYLGGIIK